MASMPRLRWALFLSGLFVLLTIGMTWPQTAGLVDRAAPHHDVYFNLWRLEWFAHALATRPSHLLDGNIFYPEPRTLTLSDAMIVEGLVGAPLIWLGLPPLLVHNLLLLGAIALSGAAMFALVRELTRSRGAGVVAGIVFAFVPYRFEHYMHMELQWTIWMPLAFLFLHRTIENGRKRDAIGLGVMIGLQMLSSIYYGVFLGTLIALCAVLLVFTDRRTSFGRSLGALTIAGLVAIAVIGVYAIPYIKTRDSVRGERPTEQILMFSARPSSYLVATPTNRLYGDMFRGRGRGERRLFPGFIVLILALCGLLLRSPPSRVIVYLIAVVVAFEMSLGFSGYTFRFLYDHVDAYRALRAPARLGIFVVMFLGVIAGFGYVALTDHLKRWQRRTVLAAIVAGLLVEYRVRLDLIAYPNTAPDVYQRLADQPVGVVAEFPVADSNFPDAGAEYEYMSTFHWFPLVNGYSGVFPPSYLARRDKLEHFPSAASLAQLRHDGVRYVIVHAERYAPDVRASILDGIARSGSFIEIGSFQDGRGLSHLYTFR
jgi:hypothetical protein